MRPIQTSALRESTCLFNQASGPAANTRSVPPVGSAARQPGYDVSELKKAMAASTPARPASEAVFCKGG